jgi:predicted nucleic acid-binding protein
MMSNFVVFDTSIFIDHLRTGRHQQRIAATTGLVRNSAVVLAELSR